MKTTPMRTNESAAGSTRLLHRLTAALLALVLAASAALPVFAADTAPTDTIYINSVSDLLAFADKCGFDQWSKGKTVILQEDLSLEDTEWAPVASFSGAFKGNGHTISDVSLVGAYSPAGFFGILEEGGSIQDLTIKGVVNPAGTQKTAGGLVGTNYGTIINCTFSGAVHGEEEAGGLVGRNETSGTIDHSTSRAMVSGAYATGGIVGYNLGVITGCTNVGAVNSEYQESALDMEGLPATLLELVKKDMGDDLSNNISNVSSDTGGIAGRSSGLILSSANAGDVGYAHVGYNVGGIVGRTDGLISGCVNQGLVQGRKDVGGIAGQAEPYVELDLDQSTINRLRTELDTLVQAHLGNLGFAVEVHEDAEDRERIRPMFVMGSSALDEEVPWAARLAEEVLRETDFADTERIRDILGQRRIAMEQAFASAGHSAAMARVASYYLPAGVVREALSGVGFYRFLKELLAHFDERAGELTAKLADLAARLFTDGGCTLSFGGSEEALDAYREASAPFDGMAGAPVLTVPAPEDKHEAFVVASDVTYTACGWDRRLLGEPYGGTWLLASRILSYDFLWTEVRVKGGAYGAGFQTTRSGSSRFYSYRDPRIDETVERFRTAGDWLAGVFSPTESEMDGYVVSTVASLDAPAKARELLRRQDGLYFSGATLADRARVREEVRAARTEDVRALAPSVDAIAGAGCVCAFGNGEVIRASGEDFNVVDLLA